MSFELFEDHIFTEEAGHIGESTGQGEYTGKHSEISDGYFFSERAEFEHILLVMASEDNGTGAEEEECFEESVGKKMEDTDSEGPGSHRHKHITQLADGGEGEDFFDIILEDSNKSGSKSGE